MIEVIAVVGGLVLLLMVALAVAVAFVRGGFIEPFCFGRYVWTNSDCAECAYQARCKAKVESQFRPPTAKKWALEAVPGQYVIGAVHDEIELTQDIEKAYHFHDELAADAWAAFYERNFLLECKVVEVSDESDPE